MNKYFVLSIVVTFGVVVLFASLARIRAVKNKEIEPESNQEQIKPEEQKEPEPPALPPVNATKQSGMDMYFDCAHYDQIKMTKFFVVCLSSVTVVFIVWSESKATAISFSRKKIKGDFDLYGVVPQPAKKAKP
jgi:hypothetical protein